MCDPTGVFRDVDHYKMLSYILEFLTDDVVSVREAKERVNEVDYLIDLLTDVGIVQDHQFQQAESYLKIAGILFAICESIADMFGDTSFYANCRSFDLDSPTVIQLSRSNFAIVSRPH